MQNQSVRRVIVYYAYDISCENGFATHIGVRYHNRSMCKSNLNTGIGLFRTRLVSIVSKICNPADTSRPQVIRPDTKFQLVRCVTIYNEKARKSGFATHHKEVGHMHNDMRFFKPKICVDTYILACAPLIGLCNATKSP